MKERSHFHSYFLLKCRRTKNLSHEKNKPYHLRRFNLSIDPSLPLIASWSLSGSKETISSRCFEFFQETASDDVSFPRVTNKTSHVGHVFLTYLRLDRERFDMTNRRKGKKRRKVKPRQLSFFPLFTLTVIDEGLLQSKKWKGWIEKRLKGESIHPSHHVYSRQRSLWLRQTSFCCCLSIIPSFPSLFLSVSLRCSWECNEKRWWSLRCRCRWCIGGRRKRITQLPYSKSINRPSRETSANRWGRFAHSFIRITSSLLSSVLIIESARFFLQEEGGQSLLKSPIQTHILTPE